MAENKKGNKRYKFWKGVIYPAFIHLYSLLTSTEERWKTEKQTNKGLYLGSQNCSWRNVDSGITRKVSCSYRGRKWALWERRKELLHDLYKEEKKKTLLIQCWPVKFLLITILLTFFFFGAIRWNCPCYVLINITVLIWSWVSFGLLKFYEQLLVKLLPLWCSSRIH